MPAVAAGAAVVGAGVGIYGAISSANAQADIDQQKAGLEREQATEVIQRQALNDVQLQESTYRSKLRFGSAFAASGHEGAGIGSQLELQRQANVQQSFNDREAQFQSYMLQRGASMQDLLASDTRTAGYLNAGTILAGGIGKIANPGSGVFGGGSSVASLPALGPGETLPAANFPSESGGWA